MNRAAFLTTPLFICLMVVASIASPKPGSQALPSAVGSTGRAVYEGEAVGRDSISYVIEGDLGDQSTPFTLELNRYTSTQDVERYAQILKTKGQEGLLQALSKENLGYFRLNGQPDRTVIFAQQRQDETGRTITVLCRRWLNAVVEGYENRAKDFPFAYIELSIDNSGKGKGTMFTGAGVKFWRRTGNIVDVACYAARVDFTNNPVSIIGVQDYANDRDWLKDVQFKQATLVQVQR